MNLYKVQINSPPRGPWVLGWSACLIEEAVLKPVWLE